jgi:intracellular sulfur oxidation DsrE/DsrF family protein
MTDQAVLKVVLHAPTADALQRARNNAGNLLREQPGARIKIVLNAQAVIAALDDPQEALDAITWLCPNTLNRAARQNRAPLQVLAHGAIVELARLQQDGWVYIRA